MHEVSPEEVEKALRELKETLDEAEEVVRIVQATASVVRRRMDEVKVTLDMAERVLRKIKRSRALYEFLSEESEWHVLWLGFYSAFKRIKPETLPPELKEDVKKEYHYYLLGHFIARVVQVALVAAGITFIL